jgi:hypothetical protein
MASFDTNDTRDEALWDLLGRARGVNVSPYFARKVLRVVEASEEPRPAWWQAFLRVVAPTAICAGIVAMAIVGAGEKHRQPSVANADIEFETIQNLDLLVSSYESSLWLDSSSR